MGCTERVALRAVIAGAGALYTPLRRIPLLAGPSDAVPIGILLHRRASSHQCNYINNAKSLIYSVVMRAISYNVYYVKRICCTVVYIKRRRLVNSAHTSQNEPTTQNLIFFAVSL